jgi:hypothetical protein
MKLTSREKLFEEIKPLVNSPYWEKLQDLLDLFISEKRDSLERVTNFEDVMRLRGSIESFREVKELDNAVKLFDEATKLQSRNRESQLYDQAN